MTDSFLNIPGVREHLEQTTLGTTESFLGKEHIWHIAHSMGMLQSSATRVFQGITFPLEPTTMNSHGPLTPLNPGDYGLVILPRDDIGLPYPPDGLFKILKKHTSPYIFTIHQEEFGHSNDDVDTVVQTGSLLTFLDRISEYSFRGFSIKSRRNARLIGQEIVAHLK
jgi:hypothetical protein